MRRWFVGEPDVEASEDEVTHRAGERTSLAGPATSVRTRSKRSANCDRAKCSRAHWCARSPRLLSSCGVMRSSEITRPTASPSALFDTQPPRELDTILAGSEPGETSARTGSAFAMRFISFEGTLNRRCRRAESQVRWPLEPYLSFASGHLPCSRASRPSRSSRARTASASSPWPTTTSFASSLVEVVWKARTNSTRPCEWPLPAYTDAVRRLGRRPGVGTDCRRVVDPREPFLRDPL